MVPLVAAVMLAVALAAPVAPATAATARQPTSAGPAKHKVKKHRARRHHRAAKARPRPRPAAPATSAAVPFAPTSFWRTPLAGDAAVDPGSSALVASLRSQVSAFGPYVNTSAYSAPVYEVGADQPVVHVTLDAADAALQGALDAVPLPPGAQGSSGSDSTAIVWQPATDTLWELWRLRRAADGWHARWGGRITQVSASDGIYPAPYGVAASGLSILGGLMRPGEVSSGDIGHALSLAVPRVAARTFRWPATRTDGTALAGGIPLGTRLRLDPSLDVGALGLPPAAATIARAAQRYGMVVTDTANCVCLAGQDPETMPSDPWPAIFGMAPWQLLAHFPWDRLQVLAVPR